MRYERSLAISSRQDRLIELIGAGGFLSPELGEKLEVPAHTIYRDVNFLKDTGYSNRSEKHANCWAYHLLAEPATVSKGKGLSRK